MIFSMANINTNTKLFISAETSSIGIKIVLVAFFTIMHGCRAIAIINQNISLITPKIAIPQTINNNGYPNPSLSVTKRNGVYVPAIKIKIRCEIARISHRFAYNKTFESFSTLMYCSSLSRRVAI